MDDAHIRTLLEERRRELAGELARLTAVPRDPLAAVSFGKRVGDGTAEAVERIATTAQARSIAVTAAEVDRALIKLDEGTYGVCDGCGAELPDERLEAIPWTAFCVSCRSARTAASR